MNQPIFHIVSDSDQLAQKLAQDVGARLNAAISNRGQATLVVSGGSTPKPFLAYLAEQALDWAKVRVTLADERCVEPDDANSNAKLVRENLFHSQASSAHFLPLFEGGDPNMAAAEKASARLSELPTYDAVILGMGGDGHTASIFPQAGNLQELLAEGQTESAALVDPVTVTPLRITQTANRLLNSRFLALHITGREKAELLARILATPDTKQWPVSQFITQQKVPINIYCDI